MQRSVIGLDIGGANLKAAHSRGAARTEAFAVWKDPKGLTDALDHLLRKMPWADVLAVTMTAELCDCYATKREGVNAILDAVEALGRRDVIVWQNSAEFVTVADARRQPQRTAAANWLALATFASGYCPEVGPALVIDIGSTTTDVIPIVDGTPVPQGRTDLERLAARELLYMGVRRTPICALFGPDNGLAWKEGVVPPAAELFATTCDTYLVLGEFPEDRDCRDTADGRPATKRMAHARLARMICADTETFGWADATMLARQVYERQKALLWRAVATVSRPIAVHRGRRPKLEPATRGRPRKDAPPPRELQFVVIAGVGEFLARAALAHHGDWKPHFFSLAERLGPKISEAACAYALAVLAADALGG
jgi:probable H4MPT-linked C1 transfer pathway protein